MKQLNGLDGAAKEMAVTSRQNTAVKTAQFLQKIGLGGNYYFVKSYIGKNGERVFADRMGVERSAHNGMYYSNGDIYIDLNAGRGNIALFTLSHELTHFIQQWDATKYKELADFLAKHYAAEGINTYAAIKQKQAALIKARGKQVLFTEAYHEFVADSLSTMFSDGNLYNKLLDLKKTDTSIFQRMKRFVDNLGEKARRFYRNETAPTLEGQFAQFQDKEFFEQLQQKFADALVGASTHYRSNKNTAENGGMAASMDESVQYSLNVNAKTELHKALYDKKYLSDVLLRNESPAIMLAQKGVNNLPMVMKASHIRENVFTEEEARKLGLRVDGRINYHGLGEEFFLQIIDGLDNVKEAYRGTKNADDPSRKENYFLLVSEFTDRDGNIINVPIYINEHAQHNRVFIDVNKISTVYGKRNFRDYISKQLRLKNLVRIKNRSTESSERSAPIAESYRKDASVSSIRNPNGEVNTKFDEAQKTVETKTESEPVANDDNGDVIPFDVEQEDVQNSVSTSQKNKKCSKKSIVKTFRNGQNAKGEFVANVLIDLADLNSEWWTGGYNYDMLGVSKTDDTEFRQFHQEIEKRTKDMDEYGKSTQPAVSTSFTIHDGSGKEYIYRVLLDGYLHGVVLGKIDKAKYDAFVKKYEGGETHGRTIADTVRRVSRTRTELGRKDTGSSWGGKSDGNSGSGRVAGVSPQRDNGGNDSGGQSTNHPVSAVTELNDTRNSDRTGESISNRTLLANALESTLQGDLEQKRLAEYRELIPKMEKEEQHLNELNAKIRELSFAKGPRDKEKIRALREDAIKTANRINIYDKQLLRLEASKPLQNVLLREKKKAYDRAKTEGQNAMKEYKSEAERKQQDIISRYQESRKRR